MINKNMVLWFGTIYSYTYGCWFTIYLSRKISENRVYRLGQTKPVHIVRFVVEHTLEETIAEINRSRLAVRDGSTAATTTNLCNSGDHDGSNSAGVNLPSIK